MMCKRYLAFEIFALLHHFWSGTSGTLEFLIAMQSKGQKSTRALVLKLDRNENAQSVSLVPQSTQQLTSITGPPTLVKAISPSTATAKRVVVEKRLNKKSKISPPKDQKSIPRVLLAQLEAEQARTIKLDELEAEIELVERLHADLKASVGRTVTEHDKAQAAMSAQLRTIDDVRDHLKATSGGLDNAEETAHKAHIQALRDVFERLDRVRDQCKDIRDQIRKQRHDLEDFDRLNPSRSVYIVYAVIAELALGFVAWGVWLFEFLTGIKAPQAIHDLIKWPSTITGLRLKAPLATLPSTTPAKRVSNRAKSSSTRRHIRPRPEDLSVRSDLMSKKTSPVG
uniref:Transmembrane protein n=1 Tax=Panagrellus redivivus TaxID=6233 RepID=A0A7E4V9W0_PANRE